MKTKITAALLAKLSPKEKAYRIHDTAQPGLFIRVLPSGHMSYMVTWARNQALTLGRVGKMTLEQARTEAAQYLAEAHAHGEPLAVTQDRKNGAIPILETFLTDHFEPWAKAHQKDAINSCRALRKSFATLLPLRIDEVDSRRVEQIRTGWLTTGLSMASANRNMTRLRGLLSRAVDWGFLESHPLQKLKRLKVDKRGRVRFLSFEEEARLRKAMIGRELKICADRERANLWRAQRNKVLLDDLSLAAYADHLQPLVLISLNTGMRRGEVFNLKWDDISFEQKRITVEGETSKSGQTRHIPINTELYVTLSRWRERNDRDGFVFPGRNGKRLDNVKKSWSGLLSQAKIKDFRWHDLRHTFASKLVMKGVAINTVRELLGHSDLAMTLRYAHLATDTKVDAVELL